VARKSKFEKALANGATLFESDNGEEAREAFLAALEFRPGEAEALSCLGLSFLRESDWGRACDVYSQLVNLFPDDVAHRRNLGLVHLKLGHFEEAQVQLERSKGNRGGQSRGLGFWEGGKGHFARAYKAFVSLPGAGDWGAHSLFTPDECDAMFEDAWALTDVEGTEPAANQPRDLGLPVSNLGKTVTMAPHCLMSVPSPNTLVMRAGAGGLMRCGDLLAVAGDVRFESVFERARGRTSERRFGGYRPFCLVEGAGFVVRSDAGAHYHLVAVQDEVLYVREDCVAGFEASLKWENGRLPKGNGVAVVQFRGSGLLALQVPEELVTVEVLESRSLTVGAARLWAWTGDVVPRPHAAREEGRPVLSCMGSGRVFLEAPC